MVIFTYDKSFEGLLSVVFEAYYRKRFPDVLLGESESLPLFYDEVINVFTEEGKSQRVWAGLKKKLSPSACSMLTVVWLSELPKVGMLMFRYICKAIDAPRSIEMNFGDPDVLELSKIWKKVGNERERVLQFTRFQKTADDTYFAPFEPIYNVLPLVTEHFRDRFADQKWLIYDLKREYGYYYDLSSVTEVTLENNPFRQNSGKLQPELLADDEKLFQKLWKEYFRSITIRERQNLKLHRQHLPVRFWKYLTEKQS